MEATARTPHRTRRALIEVLLSLALFAVTFLVTYRFARVNMDAHHTGLVYKTALDIANGKALFAETFTQYGSLSAYIQALAILIGGERITSILFVTALFYSGSFVLLYYVARRHLPRGLAYAASLVTAGIAPFFLWDFHPWSSVFALFFLLLSLYLLQLGLERRTSRSALVLSLLSGLSAALTFWARQPVGLVSILAGLLALAFPLLLLRKSHTGRAGLAPMLIAFGIGTSVGLIALFIPILATHAVSDFIQQSFTGMATFASSRASTSFGFLGTIGRIFYNLVMLPFMHFWTHPVLNFIWWLLPLSALTLALRLMVRMFRAARANAAQCVFSPKDLSLLAYSIYAVAEWHQYYPVDCLRHWYWGAFVCLPAVLVLLADLFAWLGKKERFRFLKSAKNRLLALTLAFAVLFAPNVLYRAVKGGERFAETEKVGRYENPYYSHLNGLYLSAEMRDYYDRLFETMHTLQTAFPNVNVVNATENGIYAVFGENFCPMFNNTGDFFYAEYPTWLADYVRTNRPIVIGASLPAENYVLYCEMKGYDGDVSAQFHRMPANIYLPTELYEQLVPEA